MVREGKLNAKGFRFAIVVSRFNSFITDRWSKGLDALKRHGADENKMTFTGCPVLRDPAGGETARKKKESTPVVCLGAVIKGHASLHYVLGSDKGDAQSSLSWKNPLPSGSSPATA
jgi:6,7-dimethyl-8-ribityllumazine synthase